MQSSTNQTFNATISANTNVQKSSIQPWLVIILLIAIPPLAFYAMFKDKYYHFWFLVTLWIYATISLISSFALRFFTFPQLATTYKELNIRFPDGAVYIILLLFIFFSTFEIIYGVIIKTTFKREVGLSKFQLWSLIILLILHILIFGFGTSYVITNILSPLYNLTSIPR